MCIFFLLCDVRLRRPLHQLGLRKYRGSALWEIVIKVKRSGRGKTQEWRQEGYDKKKERELDVSTQSDRFIHILIASYHSVSIFF